MPGFPLNQSGLRWLWLSFLILSVDVFTKLWVVDFIADVPGSQVSLLPFFNITYLRNYGAAFGLFSDQDKWQRWLLIVFPILAIAFLGSLMRNLPAKEWRTNIIYALVAGGAAGNAFDRAVHGFVIDYIDFFLFGYHYPAFNVADSAIFIGATMLLLNDLASNRRRV